MQHVGLIQPIMSPRAPAIRTLFQPAERARAKLAGGERECGQTMIEYVVVAGVLLASFVILTLFLLAFQEYGARILDMIASDYP